MTASPTQLALAVYAQHTGDLDSGLVDTETEGVIIVLIAGLLDYATQLSITSEGRRDIAKRILDDALNEFEADPRGRPSVLDQLEVTS